MTRQTRRFIFYSFVFLFIITGISVVFYSQGWRPVFQNNKIEFKKTGAVFIETIPKGVMIKIGNEIFQDKPGLMQSGTLIDNLLPKNYKIEIRKDGYISWVKNIAVKSGLVSEISKTILIPQNLEKKLISLLKSADNFWINSDGKIVFGSGGNLRAEGQNSSLVKLRGDKFIGFSDDNNKIITADSKTQIYYLYDINNLSQTLNITAALNNLQKISIKQIAFHPLNSNRLIIQDKNNLLYILDTNRPNLDNIIKEPVLAWTVKSPNIYYIKQIENSKLKTKNYMLASFNLILKSENFNFELPSQLINQKISKISASANKIAFLSGNGGLYLFNRQNQDFRQIAHFAENFAVSPDTKKIAFWDKACPVGSQRLSCGDGKLNIYFIEDYQEGTPKKAGDVISFDFYQKNGGNIKNIYWHKDSLHLFIENQTSMDFLEIDDREPINKYTLTENASNFYYEQSSNRLYFIEKNNLYFLEI